MVKKTRTRMDWASLSILQLQALYKKEVGRETGSTDRNYIQWKIREARKGNVRVGPERMHEPKPPQALLTVRIDADAVEFLDAAWRKHGLRSRNHLVINALYRWFDAHSEPDGVERFAKMLGKEDA